MSHVYLRLNCQVLIPGIPGTLEESSGRDSVITDILGQPMYLWMLQCKRHWTIHSYKVNNFFFISNHIIKDSLLYSWLNKWKCYNEASCYGKASKANSNKIQSTSNLRLPKHSFFKQYSFNSFFWYKNVYDNMLIVMYHRLSKYMNNLDICLYKDVNSHIPILTSISTKWVKWLLWL